MAKLGRRAKLASGDAWQQRECGRYCSFHRGSVDARTLKKWTNKPSVLLNHRHQEVQRGQLWMAKLTGHGLCMGERLPGLDGRLFWVERGHEALWVAGDEASRLTFFKVCMR